MAVVAAEMPEGHFENLWFSACVPVHSTSDGIRWSRRRLQAVVARRNDPRVAQNPAGLYISNKVVVVQRIGADWIDE